jgi:hypothetical protein
VDVDVDVDVDLEEGTTIGAAANATTGALAAVGTDNNEATEAFEEASATEVSEALDFFLFLRAILRVVEH